MGYYYSETTDEGLIDEIIENAWQNAELIDSDDKEFIYDGKDAVYAKLSTYNENIGKITAEQMTDFALKMEKTALDADKRIKNVLTSTVSVGESYVSIGNTSGLDISEKSNYIVAYIDCVAEENGETKENGSFAFYTGLKADDAEKLALEAVEKTVEMFGAVIPETGMYDVILRNEASSALLSCFIGRFYGENVQKGFSLLKGKKGEKIAADCITLIDDPHMNNGAATTAFDSEGVPTRKNVLIENGVLKMFLHNLRSAAAAGEEPTGNGFKTSFKDSVGTSATNIFISPGKKTEEELCREMGDGLLITDFMGLHAGANKISGDFSLLSSGFRVRNGKIAEPVEQITVAGNYFELIKNIVEVGSDLKFDSGSFGSPSVLCGKLSVAGK